MSELLVSIGRHRALALRIARAWIRRVPPNVQREDLEQAALIGLFEWKSAHPDETVPGWIGGLRIRINGSIKDELRRLDWLPRRRRDAERLAETPIRVVGCDDVDTRWEAHWGNDAESPEHAIDRKRIVAEALRAPMIERDAEIVRLHYFRGMMLKGIAARFGCAAPRITQRHDRALAVMQAYVTGDRHALRHAERSAELSKRRDKSTHGKESSDFGTSPSGIYPKGGSIVTATLPEEGLDLRVELQRYQDWMVEQALARAGGNKSRAAKLLGIKRTCLVDILRKRSLLRLSDAPPSLAVVRPATKFSPQAHAAAIAKLKAEGQGIRQIAAKLGLNYWVVDREYNR